MKLSAFIQDIKASATLSISAKANRLKAEGVDIISFSAGEPDFPTPSVVGDAAKAAIDAGHTLYTPVVGTQGLRAAIAASLLGSTGITFAENEIIACTGAKQALFNAFFALLDPGDEVLIPSPYWVSYPAQVKMAGGTPVPVAGRAEDGFVPSLAALEAAVTPRTRVLVLNNPSNPTGAFWDKAQLLGIVEFLRAHPNVAVISDAIYDQLVYDGLEYTELLTLAPDLRDRYVLINGFSKAFAMTGWRLGYAAGPPELIAAMGRMQSQSTSNPNSITQEAGIVALQHGESLIAPMREHFQERRDLIFELLSSIDGLRVTRPRGAFYIFPDAGAFLGRSVGDVRIDTDLDLANWLIDAARIAVVPGSPFGAPGFFRMSYACDEGSIREGCARLAEVVGRLA